MDRQQHIVVFPCKKVKDECAISERVCSNGWAAIKMTDETREAANTQRIRVAYVNAIATQAERSDGLPCRKAGPF